VEIAGGKVPPGKDSLSLWSALRSGGASPRTEALLQLAGPDKWTGIQDKNAAIRVGNWKLVIHVDGRSKCPNSPNITGYPQVGEAAPCPDGWMAMLPGPAGSASDHRNHTAPSGAALCPFHKETGTLTCLFALDSDPTETTNVAAEHGDVVKRLFGRIAAHNASHVPNTAFPPFDNASCPQPQPMTKQTVWMPWRKDGAPEGV